MKALYLALKAYILAQVPGIKDVKLYNSQELNWTEESPMALPAVLVSFESIQWTTIGGGYQEATMEIVTRLTTQVTLEEDDDLQALSLREDLHRVLQGWNYGTSSGLDRFAEQFDTSHDGLRLDIMEYNMAGYRENSTAPKALQQVQATIEIVADLVINNEVIRTGVTEGDLLRALNGALITTQSGKTIKLR